MQRSRPEGCAHTLGRISGLAGVVGGMQHTRLRADARHARQHWARRVPCPVEIHGLICEATSPPSAPSCSPARRPIGTSDPIPWRSGRCASAASSAPWAGAWAWLFPPKVNSWEARGCTAEQTGKMRYAPRRNSSLARFGSVPGKTQSPTCVRKAMHGPRHAPRHGTCSQRGFCEDLTLLTPNAKRCVEIRKSKEL